MMVDNTEKKLIKICIECNTNVLCNYRKGLCNTCYCRHQRQLKKERSPLIACACGCGEMIHSIKGNGKTSKYKRHHTPKGENHPMWKGGRIYDDDGYVLIWIPNHPHSDNYGYVREHRLVMEQYLGRYLTEIEIVHHINEIKKDNMITNLELLPSQSKHAQIHMIGTSYAKKDMSNRTCLHCNSNETWIDKYGWAHWSKFNSGFLCHSCNNKLEYERKKLS